MPQVPSKVAARLSAAFKRFQPIVAFGKVARCQRIRYGYHRYDRYGGVCL